MESDRGWEQNWAKIKQSPEEFISKCRDCIEHRQGSLPNSALLMLGFDHQLRSQFIASLKISRPLARIREIEDSYSFFKDEFSSMSSKVGEMYGAYFFGGEIDLSDLAQPLLRYFLGFSSQAKILVEAYRRFKSAYPTGAQPLNELYSQCFPDKEAAEFVVAARNVLHHEELFRPTPSYSVNYISEPRFTVDLSIDRSTLMQMRWKGPAKAYVERSGSVNLISLVRAYNAGADKFYRSFRDRSQIIFDPSYIEVQRIELAQRYINFRVQVSLIHNLRENRRERFIEYIDHTFMSDGRNVVYASLINCDSLFTAISFLKDPLGLMEPDISDKLRELCSETTSASIGQPL